MAPSLPRSILKSGLNSSRLVRLLADLTADAAAVAATSKQSFAEKLGLWLDWPDAISLAAALNSESSASLPVGRAGGHSGAQSAVRSAENAVLLDYVRVRTELVDAMLSDPVLTTDPQVTKRSTPAPVVLKSSAPEHAPEFSTYRRVHLQHQRAMVAALGPLRSQVRVGLSRVSPALGRLAALDTVLDEALGARERHLFAKVPVVLEKHFDRLRKAHQAEQAQAAGGRLPDGSAPAAAWLADYCKAMQAVMLAELELRLQPIEGMLEAMGYELTGGS